MTAHPFEPSLWAGVCRRCGVRHIEPQAVARRSDPETSWAAAASVTDIRQSQNEVFAMFRKYGPMTDEDLAARYEGRQSPSGLRTRRSELVHLGLLRDTDQRRLLSTGRKGIVWAVAA